jgi:hypothetical protein
VDLTTLSAVKQYLAVNTAGVDALIERLIARESRHIERWTGRVFPVVQNTSKRLDGTGTGILMLPDQPIIAVQALAAGNVEIPAATSDAAPGFLFDETTLYMTAGGVFPRGRQNVVASWLAGYAANVAAVIPAGNTPALLIDDPGSPAQIVAITTSNGVAMTPSASNAPAAGEYYLDRPSLLFNAADANTAIDVDMYFVPASVEQACIEMVGLDLKQRDNLGIKSKTLANETINYEGGGMTQSVKEQLWPYRKVAPA